MVSEHGSPPERRGSQRAATIHDRRPVPPGVLPRQLQMWLMVGIAVVILTIIMLTGRPPSGPDAEGVGEISPPTSIQPERVQRYQERLTLQEARRRQELSATQPAPTATESGPMPPDPLAAERQRREYESLFAENVVLSRRPPDDRPYAIGSQRASPTARTRPAAGLDQRLRAPPTGEELAAVRHGLAETPWLAPSLSGPASPPPASEPIADNAARPPDIERQSRGEAARSADTGPIPTHGPVHRLLEGTVIEAVLVNRLDGTFSGPVQALVTTPVYAHGRQHVVIPAGSRVLGSVSPVETWGDARLAVRFHRLILPDGRSQSLNQFQGLNQIGETGLKDRVDRHYWQVFGASLAIGAISGLAQVNTYAGVDGYRASDGARHAAGASLAASTGRVLDRYLNVLPTITIREGHRLKVYLTNDLDLPAYAALAPTVRGGIR